MFNLNYELDDAQSQRTLFVFLYYDDVYIFKAEKKKKDVVAQFELFELSICLLILQSIRKRKFWT